MITPRPELMDAFHTVPPRQGPNVDALVAETTKLMRWALYTLLVLDAALILLTVFASDPARRLQMAVAMVLVFGLFSTPFVWMLKRAIKVHRRMIVDGICVDATVASVSNRSVNNNPIHQISVHFADPTGGACYARFSMAGGPAGLEQGDRVELLCNFHLNKRIVAVLTPRHGIQPGRWGRSPDEASSA